MAEPSSMAEAPSLAAAPAPTPGAAAAPETVHYTMGPDEEVLQELDLAKAKSCLTRVIPHVPLLDFVCLILLV